MVQEYNDELSEIWKESPAIAEDTSLRIGNRANKEKEFDISDTLFYVSLSSKNYQNDSFIDTVNTENIESDQDEDATDDACHVHKSGNKYEYIVCSYLTCVHLGKTLRQINGIFRFYH